MIVIDALHLSGVDFNLSGIVSFSRTQTAGARLAYTDMGRPDHGLCLVKTGGIIYADDEGREVSASEGDVIYLPRGKRYSAFFEGRGGCEESDVLINFLLTDDCGRDMALSDDIFRLTSEADEETVGLFETIVSCGRGNGGVMHLKMLMFQLMDRLLGLAYGRSCGTIEECVSYIDTNYADIADVSELAVRCGLGETAFRKRFREKMGMSPVHYINAVKVERACRMLRSSEITAADVCRLLNFYDLAYFHKVFKRYTGKTPGEFGKEYHAKGMASKG